MTVNQPIELLEEFSEPNFADLLGGVDESLVIKFFHYFSRFEHALKLYGCKITEHGYVTGANWHEFADRDACPTYPTQNSQVNIAVMYICQNPVTRQREDLTWQPNRRINPCSFSAALRRVPYIRNNLFHGGKYLRPNVQRDTSLLKAGICLMQHCLTVDPLLYEYFLCTDR